MNNDEYRQLLQLIRERLRSSNLIEWDIRIQRELRMDNLEPEDLLLAYLRRLRQLALAHSDRVTNTTLGLLRQYIRTEEGGIIEGVRLMLSPTDSELYGVNEILLSSEPSYTGFADSLDVLINDIQNDLRGHDASSWEPEGDVP